MGSMNMQWLWSKARCGRRHGQGFVEYALIFLVIVLAVAGALALIAPNLSAIFSQASSIL